MAALAVLGAGAWGTAIAAVLASRHGVSLWARDATHARSLSTDRRNSRYLPEISLPASLGVVSDFGAAVSGADLQVVATPVSGLRDIAKRLSAAATTAPLVWLCKGFEQETGLLPHEIVAAELGEAYPCAVLSGPSFALEVGLGLPCALTLASRDAVLARALVTLLHGGRMRLYHSTDVVGVEIGGAVKNVMAVAVGISDGLGLGQNARAALVTRGLAEITRLGLALGASAETLMGLACAGDLILTATGDLSRNRRVGLELARGRPLAEIVASLGHVAEGVRSAAEVAKLAARHRVDMPVSDAVNAVLAGRLSAPQAVERLLAREAKGET
ncbi:MAG: NAD(P)H-dependent glycerol-3-phosphate dehydrogenase [Burkholderiales bacterium]